MKKKTFKFKSAFASNEVTFTVETKKLELKFTPESLRFMEESRRIFEESHPSTTERPSK